MKEGGSKDTMEKKTPPPKSLQERKPQGTMEKQTPKSIEQRKPQGGTQKQVPKAEGRNVPPPTPNTQRGGNQLPPKGTNKDGEHKMP